MQHCCSMSLYKSALFPETLCLLGDQSWFYSYIYKGLCFDVTCNYHYLVAPFTKLLIFISIKCQAFSPLKHVLSPRMYILHMQKCILYLYACTSIQNLFLSWGPHLAKLCPFYLSASILSFLAQLTDFSFPFLFSKISCFLL